MSRGFEESFAEDTSEQILAELRGIKMRITILLVLVTAGLVLLFPDAPSFLIEVGVLGIFAVPVIGVAIYAFFYVVDVLFQRPARLKREKEMEEKMQKEIDRYREANGEAQIPSG